MEVPPKFGSLLTSTIHFIHAQREEEVGLGNYEATWLRVDSYLSKGGVLYYIMITFKYCLTLLLLLNLHPNATIAIRLRSCSK